MNPSTVLFRSRKCASCPAAFLRWGAECFYPEEAPVRGVPDHVVLVATLGGFGLMGFNGFVIGPVIAAMFLAVFELLDRLREARPIG